MRIESTFLRSKVARRIFGLFVISTLVPVALLAFFSYRQINTLTNESVQKHLRQEAKGYGGALYARLGFLDKELTQIASFTSEEILDIKSIPKRVSGYFLGIRFLKRGSKTKTTWGNRFDSPTLSDLESEFLGNGKTLILTEQRLNLSPQIYLLRTIKPNNSESYIIAALVNPDYLWGKKETFDLRLGFCIFDENNVSLFCSEPNLQEMLNPTYSQVKSSNELLGENILFTNLWELYLKPHYFLPKLTIVFSQAKNEALAPLNTFKSIFGGVIIFSLLAVAYISIYLIRRNMKPLELLTDGINRISNDDFSHPVPVTSQDEFGLLASSFNSMSSRISRQLSVLTALAEIDRLILTRLKIEDIISVVMTRTSQIIPSDLITVAVMDKDNENLLVTHTTDFNHLKGIYESNCKISQQEIADLAAPWLLIATKNEKHQLYEYLKPMILRGANYSLVLPVSVNEKLVAILILGFVNSPLLSDVDKVWARDYADRIAVAFSNASWEETLYYQAHYDVLTGLPNRQLLNDRLQQALLQAKREDSAIALLFIDLDRFKSVNDSLGHSLGDSLLKEVAERINHNIREGDSAARMGGDEFIVVLPNITRDSSTSTRVAMTAEKLLECISKPLALEGHDIRVTASIGIVLFPNDGVEVDKLIKNADAAMYHAKEKGKGNYQFYSEKLNASTLKRLLLESDLIGAVDRNEFELYYQPKVKASSGKMLGAEALIRWNHPNRGLVPPFEFIPLVEQTSMIITIGEWVIRTACFQNKSWQQQGLEAILVAVNVAVNQLLHPGFVDSVEKALRDSELEPRWLELEITESAAMDNMKGTLLVLNELKTLGVSLSIDDYGTGYSSLQYMKDFPVDVLKIDQSFIFNLLDSPKDAAIVQSTIALAHNFGLKVIAEGVETKAHQIYLAEQGCDELQGYLFSRPLPAEEFIVLLKEGLDNTDDSQ